MKLDRLIGILAMLLQKDMVTAPQLASHFEVSRRTISRDIESLCRAGIPVCTRQGANGGISIMEGYRMERTLFSSREMQEILAGLRGLDSVSGSRHYARLMEKLCPGASGVVNGRDSMLIDLSSWYKKTLVPKIEVIQSAIEKKRLLCFCYYGPGGESRRTIEPYHLVFRWSAWYVWGWCRDREDYRLFKLNRMEEVTISSEDFPARNTPFPDLSNERIFPGGIPVRALFAPEVKWRLVEEFGPECFIQQENGWLLFQCDYTDKDNLISWLLAFGDRAVLLEPESVREELAASLKRLLALYESDAPERLKDD